MQKETTPSETIENPERNIVPGNEETTVIDADAYKNLIPDLNYLIFKIASKQVQEGCDLVVLAENIDDAFENDPDKLPALIIKLATMLREATVLLGSEVTNKNSCRKINPNCHSVSFF